MQPDRETQLDEDDATMRRFWVAALVGPCTAKQALDFTEAMAEVSDQLRDSLGAAWGVQVAEDA